MAKKEVSFSINIDELDKQLAEQREEDPQDANPLSVRSTVFTLGKDPRVGMRQQISAPDLFLLEILKDRMDNPYIQLNWRVLRSNIDSGRIIGFNIYRRRMPDEDSISFKGPLNFSRASFDKLARGNKKVGKFSAERKAVYNIKRGSIPLDILNPNLARIRNYQESQSFGMDVKDDSPSYSEGEFERFFNRRRFQKIGYVDYTKFSAEEKNKFLLIKDRNFVDISFKDKSVGFSETFEYYVDAVSKELEDVPRSNVVSVTVEDTSNINPPRTIIAKQISETQIQLSITFESGDKVAKVMVYRKSDDEVFFDKLVETENITDTVNIVDEDIRYTKSYTYRVFAQSVHGTISEPKEVTIYSSVQKITPESRSNNLKIPIVSAVQDQNSDYVKITIYPNDPSISYYELKRRDLSIFEKKFSVPSKLETNYGDTGWTVNKFFVERSREPLAETSQEDTSPLKTKTVTQEISFIDNTVSKDHIYQYRVRGYDLFGNASSYGFALVKVVGKKSIRTPVNIRSDILRGFPFRVKILWDDDNLAVQNTEEELFAGDSPLEKQPNKVLYKVQRRKLGEIVYESFPLTANNFIIDEVSCVDAVAFSGKKIEDTYTRVDNSQPQDEKMNVKDDIRRAFKLPNFMKENDIYFYRIIAASQNGEESNASEEFQISSLADLSDPLGFSAEVVNSKVKPLTVKLDWEVDVEKAKPDYWTIERKFESENDSFVVIGKAYLDSEFFDRNVELNNTYIYRIKAFDAIGRESAYFETRLTL